MSFAAFGLSAPLLRAVAEKGYATPTAIQVRAIPAVLSGKDVMAAAQTGTGKTAGFTLPLLQLLASGPRVRANHIRALVLTPTRELAVQVAESVATYGKYLALKSGVVFGGVKINPQMMKLRGGLDVLVATPGRLLDLFNQNAVRFAQVETLVLDEADRMLDMGFIGDINKILALLPKKRQNLLFSATFSSVIRTLTGHLLNHPVQIEGNPRNSVTNSVKQLVYEVDKSKKSSLFCHLLRINDWEQVLVFTRTRNGANLLVRQLAHEGISAGVIHGDRSQSERTRVLADFKANKIRILVATDIAARGLDISELPCVINFDLPQVPEDYIHRIGRTGRAGCVGEGLSLVSADEVKLLAAIESLIGQALGREVASGFIPTHAVPLTNLMKIRTKKPKKPKQVHAQDADQQVADSQKKSSPISGRRGQRQNETRPQETVAGKGNQRHRRTTTPVKKR